MVAPPWYPVPPEGYGGIELVVQLLATELAARGHHVTLLGRETLPDDWRQDMRRGLSVITSRSDSLSRFIGALHPGQFILGGYRIAHSVIPSRGDGEESRGSKIRIPRALRRSE